MRLSQLLNQAKKGRLSGEDVQRVGEHLRTNPDSPEAYTAIHILGLMGATGYRGLIESFLHSPDDPTLARIALMVLVNYWDLGIDYRVPLRNFVKGVGWDRDDDVRHVALSEAGELARETGDRELASDLLQVTTDASEDELTRDIAFDAVARALGVSYDELRRRSKLPPDDPWVRSILDRAAELTAG